MKIIKQYDSLDLAIDDPSLYDSLALAPDDSSDDLIDEIYAEGTIQIHGAWADIVTEVEVYKKTDKAYFGNVTVNIVINDRLGSTLFHRDNTWIPKSMSQNPYWICTVMFGHPEKVSNRRFDKRW